MSIIDEIFSFLDASWHFLVPLAASGLEILGIISAWHAIQKVRTAQGAIAWAVGLVSMPIVVLPLYWLVGRNKFAGYREAIREVEGLHKASVEAVRRELLTARNVGDPTSASPLSLVADVLDTPMCVGNRFQLLIDGKQFYQAVLDLIRSAEKYIYVEFYIIRDDAIGNLFAEVLCEQARAGKTVRMIYDEVGCIQLPKRYLRRLREAGIDVNAFNTRQGWYNRFQLNFRNHRKLVIVDGQRAITGGFNVGDEYMGRVRWASHWRDTGVAVTGPIARKLQAVFAADYYWAQRRDLPEAEWGGDEEVCDVPFRDRSSDPPGAAAVCSTGPSDRRERATMMFAAAAGASRKRLWISSPYLVPNSTCINALSMARARGVDVRLLVPSIADHWLVHLASFYYEKAFEQLGIPVYRYQDGFLHQKCVLVDDQLVLIGSTNLDNRSLHLNFELMLAADDPELVREVDLMLREDFSNAERLASRRGRLLPWYQRIGTVLARLFGPIL